MLHNLQSLDLSFVTQRNPEFKNLDSVYFPTLKSISFEKCNINTIPSWISRQPNLTRVSGSGNQIREIPQTILGNWTHINFSSNRIENYPDHLPLLKCDLSNQTHTALKTSNCISKNSSQLYSLFLRSTIISPNIYSAFPQLRILSLTKCRMTEIPSQLFSLCSNLVEIDLSENKFEYLENRFFTLKNLKRLKLNKCGIERLFPFPPLYLKRLRNLPLQVLDISENPFDNLEEADIIFSNLNYLKHVNISKCKVSKFPKFTNSVMTISCHSNQIVRIPNLKYLVLLQSLDISFNHISNISVLPKSLTKLLLGGNHHFEQEKIFPQIPFIKVLSLNHLSIPRLSPLLSQMKFISALSLVKVFLFEFPVVILSLSSLQYLNISYNKIRFIPEQITKLNNLKFFNVSHNPLRGLPISLLNIHSLESISCLRIKISPNDDFINLAESKKISLNYTPKSLF